MTAYRFRVKLERAPTDLWRDIVVGADRPLTAFQAAINDAVGLDQGHLWFVGTEQEYWDSPVKYQCPNEFEDSPSGDAMSWDEDVYNAGETTIGEMARQLGLDELDRICYLFDYGDEWRFYAILKDVLEDESSQTVPEVVNKKGKPVVQYPVEGEHRYQ